MKKLLTILSFLMMNRLWAGFHHPTPERNNILYELSKAPTTSLNPNSIKVLVWNLHKGANSDFAKDLTALSEDKDILIFQEMLLDQKMTDIFLAMNGFGFETATSFFYPPKMNRTGVATASKSAPSETSYVRTEILEPAIKSPKVTLITRYPISGTDKFLTVANIHSINFVNSGNFKIELERISEVLKKYPSPIIFAGDFNTWLNEKTQFLNIIRNKLNLKEAIFNPDQRLRFNKHPLDHFLYSSDLVIKTSKVDGFYTGSDHKPLEVELEYSP